MTEAKKKTDPADVASNTDPAPVDAAPTGEAQECAACGETAVFTQHTLVGGTTELTYHACDAARKLVHEYFLATMNDRTVPAPVLAK